MSAASSEPVRVELADAVGRTVADLQRRYRRGEPAAAGRLARLRRAVGTPAGTVPEVWADTVGPLPERLLGRGDAPSPSESACHAALTIYAVHQQSKRDRDMHVRGPSVGRAASALRGQDSATDSATRRFLALATASSLSETVHHLRGLVQQLRDDNIALDYGRLAEDLRRLQDPRTAPRVRLAWGRDFYRGAGVADTPESGEH